MGGPPNIARHWSHGAFGCNSLWLAGDIDDGDCGCGSAGAVAAGAICADNRDGDSPGYAMNGTFNYNALRARKARLGVALGRRSVKMALMASVLVMFLLGAAITVMTL